MFDQPEKETVSWYNTTMYILFFLLHAQKKKISLYLREGTLAHKQALWGLQVSRNYNQT